MSCEIRSSVVMGNCDELLVKLQVLMKQLSLKFMNLAPYLALSLSISSCVFDGSTHGLVGDYQIGWIDTECSMTVSRGPIGLFEGKVVELGWDSDFILVKRHQRCDSSNEDYFIIDIDRDMEGSEDQRMGVFGPFAHDEFIAERTELNVPKDLGFTLKL